MDLLKGNTSVLLVEDHRQLSAAVGAYLEQAGFVMDYAADGLSGFNLAVTNCYDAILLDVMLPGLDGFEVCRRLRQEARISTPILMLTARDQLDDKLRGFGQGADDYLIKPFDMAELEARLLALIRRNRGEVAPGLMQVHDLVFDPSTMKVSRRGESIKLSPTCLRILKVLMRESPKLVSRETLERELWGDLLPDSDTLRSHLYNLRKAIDRAFDEPLMETHQGVGFRIVAPGEKSPQDAT